MAADVLFIAPLPPPLHGASLISEAVRTRLKADYSDISLTEVSIPGAKVDSLRSTSQKTLAYMRAAMLILRTDPRVVYVSLPAGLSASHLLLLAAAMRAARWRGQLITHHHSSRFMEDGLKGRLIRSAYRSLAASAKQPPIHFCLFEEMSDAASCFNGQGVVLSNAAFDDHFLSPIATQTDDNAHAQGGKSEKLHIGHLSNLTFDKGLRTALRIGLALPRDGSATLSLAGPAGVAEEAEIRAAIAAAPDVIRWRGPLYGEEKAKFYAEIDLFLFLSEMRHEGEPVVILEAMASDVPVVSTRVGGVAEMVGETGLIYESTQDCENNIDDWLSRFRTLPPSRPAFEARRDAARATWTESWEQALRECPPR